MLLSVTINESVNVQYVNILPDAHWFLRSITLNLCGAMKNFLAIKEALENEYRNYKILL